MSRIPCIASTGTSARDTFSSPTLDMLSQKTHSKLQTTTHVVSDEVLLSAPIAGKRQNSRKESAMDLGGGGD